MTKRNNIQELLKRYILNECTKVEIETIVAYFKSGGNIEDMPNVDEVLKLMKDREEIKASDIVFKDILSKAKEREDNSRKITATIQWQKVALVASVFLCALVSGYLLWKNNADGNKSLPTANVITLELEDGRVEVLEVEGNKNILNNSGNVISKKVGKRISYVSKADTGKETTIKEDLVYNKLTVPYGNKFELELSDGTNITINSGTSIKYPVKFIKGNDRVVYLSGEAFFDVTTDKEHPFIVHSGELHTRVLGTKFNVASYPEDVVTGVVLVEGRVSLSSGRGDIDDNIGTILQPGYMGTFNKNDESIKTQSVNTGIYTSWIRGEFAFRNMLFRNILKKLERRYNVSINNNNMALDNQLFNASYGVVSIEKILKDLKIAYNIRYTIEGNKILIE